MRIESNVGGGEQAPTISLLDGAWTMWCVDAPAEDDPLASLFGRPGPWRSIRRADAVMRVFECPARRWLEARIGACDANDESARFDELASEVRRWSEASAGGGVRDGWCAPVLEELQCWYDERRLSVRSGPHLAKGEVERSAARLRVHFPELVRVPEGLSASRSSWLEAFCLDAQTRWRLVRFAIAGDRVAVEVDVSGVPPALAEPFFGLAFESIVFTVRWALPGLAVLVDPSVEGSALDRGPWWLQGVESHHGSRGPAAHPVETG